MSEPLFQNYEYIIGFLGSSPADWHFFGAFLMKGGVYVRDKKSVPPGHGCGPQVGMTVCWLASQSWVPGRT
eukprot:scaffold56893_cov17-Tisochrysis_lutea.AAC.1